MQSTRYGAYETASEPTDDDDEEAKEDDEDDDDDDDDEPTPRGSDAP